MAERIKIQPLIWRIFHCAAVEIEAVDIIKVRIGKTKAAAFRLQPCALSPKGQGGDIVYIVYINSLQRSSRMEKPS
jgi:hypothetical protein